MSIYEGWRHIADPAPLREPTINHIVLGVAFLPEGSSWAIAVREFNAGRGEESWWKAVKRSKDPAGFIVRFVDSAALLGLAIATVGVWASHWTDDARIDGMASVAIGGVLAAVAVLLAREAEGLLIGESAEPELVAAIWRLLERRPEITAINHVRTIHTTPDSIFVAASADFADALPTGRAERLIEEMEAELKAAEPRLSSIYIRPEKQRDAVVHTAPPPD